jgi:HEAT repeat protein
VNKILSSRRSIQNAGAIPLLVKALDSNQGEDTREWAAVSLGDLQAKAAAFTLARVLLQDPARIVRVSAAVALREIAAPEIREALTQAAREDSDSLVRSRAEEALAQLPRKD